MELNINKCSVLSITLKRSSIFHNYDILGAMLKRVTNHDYLGVSISSDLNWLRHVTKIYDAQLFCSAVSLVIPSVDNFPKFAIPAIMVMQPIYGAALI